MTKEEIMNTYAKEQGYEDYDDLIYSADDLEDIIYHFYNITDLIQEELKKKICDTLTLVHDMPYIEIKETINETEIL